MNPLVARLKSLSSAMQAQPIQLKKKCGHDKSNLPNNYPGAKLARKAVMGRIGRIHHGLHSEFTYTRHAKSKGL